MKVKEQILNALLDKYEKSKSYIEMTNRRISIKMNQIKDYNIEDYEQRELWNSVLKDLQKGELIKFEWEKFEENNIIKEVWLIKENVYKIYEELGRKNPKKSYQAILKQLEQCNFTQEWIKEFQNDMKNYMIEKQKENVLLPIELFSEIVQALNEIDKMQTQNKNAMILKRVFSIKCYNNSKYFERNIEKKIIRIAKRYLHLEQLTDNEILAEIGIVKYPEIIEFCGNMKCIIQGKAIEYASITKGSYINGNAINSIERMEIDSNVRRIIFIENKANYVEYIQSSKESELVIYHGGFYSPIKGEFFRKIYESTQNKNIEYFHWSDIDIGGFEIFVRLRDNIIPELKPMKMDTETLMKYKEKGIALEEEYRNKLAQLKEDRNFKIFWKSIDYMLDNNIKLEQEAIIEN